MGLTYKFSDKEVIKLLKENLVIIADTNEQKWSHIKEYFDKNKIKYVNKNMDAGDYGVAILAAPSLGIERNLHLNVAIERKANIDELCNNFGDGRTRFENEFMRAEHKKTKMILMIEDNNFYHNLVTNNYRSNYKPQSFLATLKAFEARYNFQTQIVDKKYAGLCIYSTLKYFLRDALIDWNIEKFDLILEDEIVI